jgi:hypothetical protein
LTPNACARLIKRYCRKIGFDPANYSGHSMRSGYVTSAIRGERTAAEDCRTDAPRQIRHAACIQP